MNSRRLFGFLATFWLCSAALSAAPTGIWPLNPAKPPEPADTAGLPPQLQPAAVFQTVFMRILAGKPEEDWRGTLEGFAGVASADPVSQALRQLSRVWLARVEMRRIDAALLDYYRHNVAFPPDFDVLDLPQELRRDPWGDAWAYHPHAPAGFASLASQRYELGPARLPHLAGMKVALEQRHIAPPQADVSQLQTPGGLALQLRLSNGLMAVIQPGGQAGGFTLVYIGQNWALMAGEDQLFTITF